ncbi:type I-MYXAN CRISPR-associated protein Cas5/Cmx5/DevS [Scytonema hofmannii PCC 7110]|uniref:Type I-MYXAN CRISPR-associated protein Cas5/Cmx5/DevS n=1 Tax=Scytonema hofmannii PCC 7110 TaxID=128403 RepID=A0A139X8S1_9CYAN|nr:type I-MYXAN CRISPR-associated protein Cas5/Cmx5/DevS [Scytonema hofmannii]KYC41076.1 type I-MYXAN CRISPR-associated protein Cas5/Cmx5/DevS [Scytonema hofmannii PCC 7110]
MITAIKKNLALEIEVPIACFRQSRAREYAETYLFPPPSTVYGMLLSIVGETNRYKHCGVKLAIAMLTSGNAVLSQPQKSTIIRTFRRFKKKDIHDPTNSRPDYQELLTDVKFITWIDSQTDQSQTTLSERLEQAFTNPASIERFGGLCLGESRDLVNSITMWSESDRSQSLQWLVQDEDGLFTLPYWVDHVGSKGTRWKRYLILEPSKNYLPPETAWTVIQPT